MKYWLKFGCLWMLFVGQWAYCQGAALGGAQRIVAVGSGITEMLYLLGAEHKLVGRDLSSHWPPSVTELPSVGYQRALSAEGVLSLQPDTVIGSDEMGPPAVLQHLEKAGVKVRILSSNGSPEALQQRLGQLGRWLGKEDQAQTLWRHFQRNYAALQEQTHRVKKPLRVIFLLNYGGGMRLGGRDTAVDDLIRMAGAVNVGARYVAGYRPVTQEVLFAAKPDVIVVSGDELAQGIQPILEALPVLQHTPAGKSRRVLGVDSGILMAGGSPRMLDAAQALFRQFYPVLADGLPKLPLLADAWHGVAASG